MAGEAMAMNCHFCGTELQIKIDLGRQPLANALLDSPNQEEFFYDAKWGWCTECQLLQLANPPKLEQMFTGDYPFITDSSKVMVEHFKRTAQELTERYGLEDTALVVEIGANSGNFLDGLNCYVYGYEPSSACATILDEKGLDYTKEYFNEYTAQKPVIAYGEKVDLIYSANTLRSVPQLESIFKGAYNILKDDGVFIIEEPYLMSILEGGEIDQFYDENVYCFTATSMKRIARRYGFRLVDIEILRTHGGSMRYHLKKGIEHLSDEIEVEGGDEKDIPEMLDGFIQSAKETTRDFILALTRLQKAEKRVAGYAATAKSTTMLNYCDIQDDLIRVIYDTTPEKWGKYTAGTHILIKDAKDFSSDNADVVVLFAWNHAREIVERENKIKSREWLVYAPNGVHYL